eukprot:1153231-Pelagomonas_calceolata.AAC.4
MGSSGYSLLLQLIDAGNVPMPAYCLSQQPSQTASSAGIGIAAIFNPMDVSDYERAILCPITSF